MTDKRNYTRANILFASIALLVAAATIFAADPPARSPAPAPAPAPSKQNYNDRYGVLSEHNIFMQKRGIPPRPAYVPSTQRFETSRPPAEATFVLTGIVLEEGQFRAYVEDTSTGRVIRLAVGDTVARGHVLEIAIDAIAYDLNGQGTWITVGSDLRGEPFSGFPTALSRYMATASTNPSTGVSTTNPSASGAGGAVPPATLDPSTAGLSIEERMRLRRLQGK
jgi:hypothetical protein